MTEMVYGSNPIRVTEPVLPRWWRTIDKWTLTCVFVLFGIGLLLGLAASVPLAQRNGLDPYHYVQRQAFCKDLYTLLVALTPAGQFNASKAADYAQWAVNVCDFRDADSTMTIFEYDLNPANGWDVDNDVPVFHSVVVPARQQYSHSASVGRRYW